MRSLSGDQLGRIESALWNVMRRWFAPSQSISQISQLPLRFDANAICERNTPGRPLTARTISFASMCAVRESATAGPR